MKASDNLVVGRPSGLDFDLVLYKISGAVVTVYAPFKYSDLLTYVALSRSSVSRHVRVLGDDLSFTRHFMSEFCELPHLDL